METDFCVYHCNGACCQGFGKSGLGFRTQDRSITGLQIQFMANECDAIGQSYTIEKSGIFSRISGIIIEGACPFLENGLCNVHDHPLRPEVCRDLLPGDGFCEGVRSMHGLIPVNSIINIDQEYS